MSPDMKNNPVVNEGAVKSTDGPSARKDAAPPTGSPAPPKPLQILGKQQCLSGLSQLPGLMLMNLVKPAIVNALRGVYGDLLHHHEACEQRGGPELVADDLMNMVRQNPALLNTLSPFFTDDQFQMLTREIQGNNEKA